MTGEAIPKGWVVTGLAACKDGTIHKWPSRSSNAAHTFGAAALRDIETQETSVTLYADVFGRRTGEFAVPGAKWDEAMQAIVDARGDRATAYNQLDTIIQAFGHRALSTVVTIDTNARPEEQVRLVRDDGSNNGQRTITDSIASAEAFIKAAEEGIYFSDNLLEATQYVREEIYHNTAA